MTAHGAGFLLLRPLAPSGRRAVVDYEVILGAKALFADRTIPATRATEVGDRDVSMMRPFSC